MKSGPETSLQALASFPDVDTLPGDVRDLFGGGPCDSLAWYEAVTSAALPEGAKARFLAFGSPARVVFPMLRLARGAASLTTPYTCLWSPLTAPNADAAVLRAAGGALAAWCRPHGAVRLDALDLGNPQWAAMLDGVRAAGLLALRFDHFGNWHAALPAGGFDAYLAARPGALRATISRKGARLAAAGAGLRVVAAADELPAAIAAYEAVYASSWKDREPYPAFSAALMRACAADGALRLALLEQAGKPLAAQIWMVNAGTATVLKLAYDAAAQAASPGTVLTGLMIRHLLTHDRVTHLDFGRGDDSYKRDWVGERRQRSGVLLVNPRAPVGLLALARHLAGRARAVILAPRPGQVTPAAL
jgi:hypothetical protein